MFSFIRALILRVGALIFVAFLFLFFETYPYSPWSFGRIKIEDFHPCDVSVEFYPNRFFRGFVFTSNNLRDENLEIQVLIVHVESGEKVFNKKVNFPRTGAIDLFVKDNPSIVSWADKRCPKIRKLFNFQGVDAPENSLCEIISWGLPVKNLHTNEKYRISVTPINQGLGCNSLFYAPYSLVY